ncbi:hypothetical protein UFOVP907_59 [uncultured Caudovirales phage]|jgi:hypothetical protein|uniref:Uncharacterized protein n=1 Tax=uncultured Caudovirales phage TaxID=2100421 RepID=A0A6J5PFC2_9CAUD|nr:hypothetical protein UFOVP907_59 [uncultured Caudovirales phage]
MEDKEILYKVTMLCTTQPPFAHPRMIAGTVHSPAWWNTFKYWLTTRLAPEGLVIKSIDIEEIV